MEFFCEDTLSAGRCYNLYFPVCRVPRFPAYASSCGEVWLHRGILIKKIPLHLDCYFLITDGR
jgi:hypothetical protein